MSPAKLLIVAGLVLVAAGVLWLAGQKLGLGRLPGDFVFEAGNAKIYLPLGTSLVLSVLVTLAFWLFGR